MARHVPGRPTKTDISSTSLPYLRILETERWELKFSNKKYVCGTQVKPIHAESSIALGGYTNAFVVVLDGLQAVRVPLIRSPRG